MYVCTIYEIDDHDGRPFIAMERLGGTDLKVYMARKTLDTPEIADIAAQITEALAVAHGKGIIHRDIKPRNIFIGGDRQVKVLDFGLARRLPPTCVESGMDGMEGSTIPGRPLGTASYMAPETDSADAAGRAKRPVFAGRGDLRDGDGEAPFTGAPPLQKQ